MALIGVEGDHLVPHLSRSAVYEDVGAVRQTDQDAAALPDIEEHDAEQSVRGVPDGHVHL